MSALGTYDLYGLRIRSQIPIGGPLVVDAVPPDLTFRIGEPRHVPAEPPAGRILAEADLGSGNGYAHTETSDGYVLRYFGVCEIHVARPQGGAAGHGGREAGAGHLGTVHLDPRCPPGVPGVLLSGSVPAFLLTLAGECVLHASAVEKDGRAIAIVAPSGGGKSTIAAQLCGAGARLVTDDVLRIEMRDGEPRCYLGPSAIRLRPDSVAAAGLKSAVERAPDDRILFEAVRSSHERPKLTAIVAPRISGDGSEGRSGIFDSRDALIEICRSPRTLGIRCAELMASCFRSAAWVARSAPVYKLGIPRKWSSRAATEWFSTFLEGPCTGEPAADEDLNISAP